MTDHDLHTLTGAYAADALDAVDRDVFERHLETCDSCRAEVRELQASRCRSNAARSPGSRASAA